MQHDGRFEITPPTDRASLVAALHTVSRDVGEALASLPVAAFVAPQGDFWSPADHLRHLTRSVRPLAKALGLPRLLLRLRFGKAKEPSRTLEEVVAVYRQALADGGQASGGYLPTRRDPSLDDDAFREQVLRYWRAASEELDSVVARWHEPALDRLQLPHPLLGNMTVREILLFTLYHNAHHGRRVFERS